ncbi:MAG: type II toxin-antitoxin system VapC family toxin [Acidobacteriota bacterium]
MRYADASALLRLLFAEPGVRLPLDPGVNLVSSRVVEVEIFRAIERERLLGRLTDREAAVKRKEATEILAMLDLVALDDPVMERAKTPFGVNVRTLDALHVATAEVLVAESGGEPLEFWTHDERQAVAALSRGLNVLGIEAGPGTEPPAAGPERAGST